MRHKLKDTTDTVMSVSYLDLHLVINSVGWLRSKFYEKKYDFDFPIVKYVATFQQHLHMEYISLS